MNKWFGLLPFSDACEDSAQAPIPFGQPCYWCEELIGINDNGWLVSHWDTTGTGHRPIHHECFMRQIVGSVGHQLKTCSCYGGHEEDLPGSSKRQAAIEAYLLFLTAQSK